MKKLRFLLLTFVLLLFMGVCAHAEGNVVINNGTTVSLPSGSAFEDYRYEIQTDDNSKYIFKRPVYKTDGYDPGIWPNGLDITSDGVIEGNPRAGATFLNMHVLVVEKATGQEYLIRCTITVYARQVVAKVTAQDCAYDGQPHTATVKFYDADTDEEVTDIAPVVTYGYNKLTAAVDAGVYSINVDSPLGCHIVNRTGPTDMTITQLGAPQITIANKTVPYTGSPIGYAESEITVTPSVGIAIDYLYPGETEFVSAAPTAAGVYTARVRTTNTNYAQSTATATLTIEAEKVNIEITDNTKTYRTDGSGNGVSQEPTIKARNANGEYFDENDANYPSFTVSYTDSKGNVLPSLPTDAGTYTVTVTLNDTTRYGLGSYNTRTFTIRPMPITFTTDKTTYEYDEDTSYQPIISTDPAIDKSLYNVKYKLTGTDDELDSIKDVGAYDLIISFTEAAKGNYTIAGDSTDAVSIATATVDFYITDNTYTYDGTVKGVTVSPLEHIDEIIYTNMTTNLRENNPTNAAEYQITIKPQAGYGVGKIYLNNVETTSPKLIINPMKITFTVDNNEYTYDDENHTARLTTTNSITADKYTVTYRKYGTLNTPVENVKNSGQYSILVEFVNNNYELASEITDLLTIHRREILNYGNSPAGMIYRDEAHKDNEAWRQAALDALTADLRFSASYLPAGCNASVSYPDTVGGRDLDPYTVIVDDITHFIDPGLSVDGDAPIIGTISQSGSDDNLYVVTYDYTSEYSNTPYSRYIMVVKKIGDLNGDGIVNAVDANPLDNLLTDVPANITEARVWDVNKDGKIDGDDATAIRRRFREKLTPYYNWIN